VHRPTAVENWIRDRSRTHTTIGRRVSTVAFVHDYVELHFDGQIVTALAAPRVRSGEAVVTFPSRVLVMRLANRSSEAS
jgi:hypothetical protein